VVFCTTKLKEDDLLCRVAKALGIQIFRGSTEDKLMRWKGAAEQYGVDFFVTFDGDDLLCDPGLANLAFDQRRRYKSDFIEAKNVPCGAFTYGISVSALNKVCEIKGTTDTEMMAPYFTDTGLFKVEQLEGVPEELQRPELRLTLDYELDFRQYEIIIRNFHLSELKLTLSEVIKLLDQHPAVRDLNKGCHEAYLENQKKLTKVILNESKQVRRKRAGVSEAGAQL
jgi:spore coat polysaccharide biosynthesis protein SpsF (cytidylyltransferase family)